MVDFLFESNAAPNPRCRQQLRIAIAHIMFSMLLNSMHFAYEPQVNQTSLTQYRLGLNWIGQNGLIYTAELDCNLDCHYGPLGYLACWASI